MMGPEITIEELRTIAFRDPRMASWLARIPTGQRWTELTLRVQFAGGNVGDVLSATIAAGRVGCDICIRDMVYTVERPNAFLGSPFKAQSDLANQAIPGINMRLVIDNCVRYQIEDDDAPIQLTARASNVAEPGGCCLLFCLVPFATVKAHFTLKKQLAADENPYIVTLALRGISLGCRNFDGLSLDDAILDCRQRGLLPSDFSRESCATGLCGLSMAPRSSPARVYPLSPLFGVGHSDDTGVSGGGRDRHGCGGRIRPCRQEELEAWERAFAEPAITELGTVGFDADLLGIGSSPYRGDVSSASLAVPLAPTLAPELRYLLRLASIAVPAGSFYRLKGIRTATVIGSLVPGANGGLYPLEILIESRFWRFTDGNVVFWVRNEHGAPLQEGSGGEGRAPRSLPNMTPELYGTDPALIYAVDANGLAQDGIQSPYRPPSGGVPPGNEIPGLGLIRDQRFGHGDHGASEDFDFAIPGPTRVSLWASVYQTNPATRVVLPATQSLAGANREDQFVQANPNAVIRRVAGSLVGNIAPYNTAPDTIGDRGQGGCGT